MRPDLILKAIAWMLVVSCYTQTDAKDLRSKRRDIDTGNRPSDIVMTDFDGDGYDDIATVCHKDNSLRVYFMTATGDYREESLQVGEAPVALVSGDFNGDSHIDLAICELTANQVVIYLNQGKQFERAGTHAVGNWPIDIDGADINGDGNVDLIVANSLSDQITVLRGRGNGAFAPAANYDAGWQPVSISPCDIDLDGDLDILTGNRGDNSFSVIINHDGTFLWPLKFSTEAPPLYLAGGELNDGSEKDVAIASFNAPYILVYRDFRERKFIDNERIELSHKPLSFVLADLDGDGLQDIATTNGAASNISLLLNKGGVWETAGIFEVGDYVQAIAISHATVPRLAVSNQMSNSISVISFE